MALCSFCQNPVPDANRFCRNCGGDLSNPESGSRARAILKALFDRLADALAGRYEIRDLLGRGGMGAVFLAEDLELGRRVAIKVLRPDLADDGRFVARFEREARIAAGLDHPNIIPIFAVERHDGLHYFVMKYVSGCSLDAMLTGAPLPVEEARRLLLAAASALGHAHARGVVHRDVKPANMLIADDGQLLLTDFGISKALQGATQLTATGQLVGTPQYMSPEQASGTGLDARSDQYSLGVVGYHMLVGRPPFLADSVQAVLYLHKFEPAPSVHELRPEVPSAMSEAVRRAMAKQPEERFPTIDDFAAAFRERAPPVRQQRQRWARLALAGLAAAGVAGLLFGVRREGKDPAPAPPPAVADRAIPSPAEDAPTPTPSDTATTTVAPPAAAESPPAERPPPVPEPLKPRRPAVAQSTPRAALPHEAPARPAEGFLTVNAVPYGTVSVDGVEIGDTPIVRRPLSPGQHVIRISRDGYRPRIDTVSVSAGNEIRYSRSLVEEPR